jgi:hypothetical protein
LIASVSARRYLSITNERYGLRRPPSLPKRAHAHPIDPIDDNGEQTVLYGMITGVGLLRVTVALALGESFGTEPTIGALLVGLAAVGYAAQRWSPRRWSPGGGHE